MKKSILLALIILIFPLYLYASDYYVDAVNGSNENSGLSKDDAWKTITYALTQVEGIAEEQTVIHVAVGTYDMVLGETFPLNMKDYITLKGAEKETTIIDASGSNTSVIFIKDVENVCIESIRITNGSGIKEIGSIGNCIRGGGLYIKDSENIAISNCIINNNILLQEGFFFLQGGGIYSFESSVEIEECVINDNQGGGVCFEQIFGAPQKEFVIRECTVNNNTGDSTTAGIDCIFTSPLIEDSTIIGNIGNGIFLTSSNATIKNCTIKGNNYGGLDLTFSSPVIANCDVSENTGKGGIYCWWDCYPEIRDCRINGNSNDVYNQGGGLYFKDSISTPIIIKNCEIAGNSANMGGGLYFEYSNGEISKCKIKNNIASDAGGGICCRGVSLSIRDCEITGNKAVYGGGIHDYYSSGQITDSLFAFNEAVAYGGAVHVIDFVSEEFDFIIQNCTIADNQAGIAEGGVSVAQGSLFIENSILWNNKGGSAGGNDPIFITYSCIEGGYEGGGNIDDDPLFASGPWGNYYLSQITAGQNIDSPCIDVGNETLPTSEFDRYWMTTRTDGIFDTDTIDMGYHYPPHVQFELGINPEKEIFKDGDKIRIMTDLITAPYGDDMLVDLYFVMINPENNIYSYPAWEKILQPAFLNLPLPGNLSLDDIGLFEITLPSEKPPIKEPGTYTIAILAVKPETMTPISNLSMISFEVE